MQAQEEEELLDMRETVLLPASLPSLQLPNNQLPTNIKVQAMVVTDQS